MALNRTQIGLAFRAHIIAPTEGGRPLTSSAFKAVGRPSRALLPQSDPPACAPPATAPAFPTGSFSKVLLRDADGLARSSPADPHAHPARLVIVSLYRDSSQNLFQNSQL
jgi:hypothetical protein